RSFVWIRLIKSSDFVQEGQPIGFAQIFNDYYPYVEVFNKLIFFIDEQNVLFRYLKKSNIMYR
ncbi:MAG: hypothetical protein G01um101429_817, partial [Parcubacteria group bacterium Gr01-1014_29]